MPKKKRWNGHRLISGPKKDFFDGKLPSIGSDIPPVIPLVCLNKPSIGFQYMNSGFTITELIVTLVILGVLLAIAAPNLKNFIFDQRLTTQINDLIADLNVARSEAVKRAATVTVCKQGGTVTAPQCNTTTTAAWTNGWFVFVDANANGQMDAGETVLRVRESLEGGNTMTSAGTTENTAIPYYNAANRIAYASTGLATISTGEEAQLKFCDSRGVSKAVTVRVNSTGRIRTDRTQPASCP